MVPPEIKERTPVPGALFVERGESIAPAVRSGRSPVGRGRSLGEGGRSLGEGGRSLGEGGRSLGEGGRSLSEGGRSLGEGGRSLGEGGRCPGRGRSLPGRGRSLLERGRSLPERGRSFVEQAQCIQHRCGPPLSDGSPAPAQLMRRAARAGRAPGGGCPLLGLGRHHSDHQSGGVRAVPPSAPPPAGWVQPRKPQTKERVPASGRVRCRSGRVRCLGV